MNSEAYFIKADYQPNTEIRTLDANTGAAYWTPDRIRRSGYYQFPVYRYALALAERKRLNRLIDVGCGVATKLAYIHRQRPDMEIIGIDQQNAVAFCREHYDFGTWHADHFDEPREDLAQLNAPLVICADVIEHVANPDVLLEYLKRFIAPGGQLLLSTPERDVLHGRDCTHSPNPDHVREWNRGELRALVEHHGYRVVEQFLALPVKVNATRVFFETVGRRLLQGKDPRTNQVLLLELKAS